MCPLHPLTITSLYCFILNVSVLYWYKVVDDACTLSANSIVDQTQQIKERREREKYKENVWKNTPKNISDAEVWMYQRKAIYTFLDVSFSANKQRRYIQFNVPFAGIVVWNYIFYTSALDTHQKTPIEFGRQKKKKEQIKETW